MRFPFPSPGSPPPTLESTCDCEKKCVTTLVPLHVYSPSLQELRQSAHKALEDNPDFKNYTLKDFRDIS